MVVRRKFPEHVVVVILGLIILIAAVVVAVAGVLTNSGRHTISPTASRYSAT